MKHFIIRMNEEDLKGNVGAPCDCPVTRAVKRKFPGADYVSCGLDSLTIQWLNRPAGQRWTAWRVSESAIKFQHDLMNGIKRDPITFVIREEKDWEEKDERPTV